MISGGGGFPLRSNSSVRKLSFEVALSGLAQQKKFICGKLDQIGLTLRKIEVALCGKSSTKSWFAEKHVCFIFSAVAFEVSFEISSYPSLAQQKCGTARCKF